MRYSFIVLFLTFFLTFSISLSATTYYVATNGSDSNPGTISQPWATWQKGFSSVKPGDILYIRGGTYTKMAGTFSGWQVGARNSGQGSSSGLITISGYPGDSKPILDCAELASHPNYHRGISTESCHYIYYKNLIVKNVREYSGNPSQYTGGGWEVSSSDNITFEGCEVTYCMNGFSLNSLVKNISYLNCDSYYNWDIYQGGDLCNGFNGNCSAGSTITYRGCRAWFNCDDGFDNMAGGGYMTYYNCWAWSNKPWHGGDSNGNGDGFKLGFTNKGDESGIQRTLYNCISAENGLMGFDESMDIATSMDMALYNCVAYNNSNDFGFRFYQPSGSGVTTLRNNISFKNKINYQGRSRNITDHNTWDAGAPAVTEADFLSLSTTDMAGPRKADGSLPDISFLHLASGSDMIDAGVQVGLSFAGKAPDLGAVEATTGSTVNPLPVFGSAVVESASPSVLTMNYDLTLSNVIPAVSSFSAKVNSVARTVSKVAISGNKVMLTLASPVVKGDVVTVAYTKPASNPLQTATGGQAATLTAHSVTNNVSSVTKDPVAATLKMTIYPNPVHQIINISLTYTTSSSGQDANSLLTIRIFDISGRLYIEKLVDKSVTNIQIPVNLASGIYIVQIFSGNLQMASQKIIVY